MIHREKNARFDIVLRLSPLTLLFFLLFFLMDTPEQETPRHKSMKSELISHQLQLACKKNRSNSVNGDREHEEK
jgi:hypothetical protein